MVKVIQTEDSSVAQFDMNVSFMGKSSKTSMYYKDGWSYMNSDSGKFKTPSTLEDTLKSSQYKSSPVSFYMIDEITEVKTYNKTTYKIKYSSEAIMSLFDSILSMSSAKEDSSVDFKIKELSCITNFDNKSALENQSVSMFFSIITTENDQNQTIDLDCNIEIDVNATGSNVKITPPSDLDEYLDISTIN